MAGLNKDDYTSWSWSALGNIIGEAKTPPGQADPDANDGANMLYDNQKALADLPLNDKPEEPEVVDKEALNAAIAAAEALKESDYTADSWNAMQEQLAAAKEVAADTEATQDEVYAATEALNDAVNALVKAEEPGTVDKTELYALLEQYGGFKSPN